TPETKIYGLADLSKVWINVEIYASQLPWVQPGAPVSLTLPFTAGREWRGRIDYLYPTLDTQSRTVKARLVFDNPDGVLRPGMYANAYIRSTPRESLVVPREAVIRTGARDVVILALGEGRFKPVAVRLGAENGQDVEILDGLEEGQRIALSGQFLLDAEANFQAAAQRLDGADPNASAPATGAGNPAAAGAHGGH
ncbi:MAG: efflux RND transporter periplasmic adaptor subunit, partial [Gammaproteobacteria bacterium]|nr:efflux RND transporter periplasmic adaptor subunit [Gammaproteobacteria bacterium]